MLMHVSFDPSIVQFFGTCILEDCPVLVLQYMAVRIAQVPWLALFFPRHSSQGFRVRVTLVPACMAVRLQPECPQHSLSMLCARLRLAEAEGLAALQDRELSLCTGYWCQKGGGY